MSKQKTIMMELINDLENDELTIYAFLNNKNIRGYYIEKEKSQIIDAVNNGCSSGMCYIDSERDGINYYNETYKQD